MKCVILAAGYATRLYPLTENFPKPLLDIKGKGILEWLIGDIEQIEEMDEVIVVSNHKFIEHFTKWVGKLKTRLKITVLDDGSICNEDRLGAVKDIAYAIENANIQDDMMVLAGDNLLDFSMEGFYEFYNQKKSTCIMRYFEESVEKLRRTGGALIDENDKVLEMAEKPQEPKSNWAVPPFYIYKKEDLAKILDGVNSDACDTDAPGSFISWFCTQRNVYAYPMPGKRYDIGNLESYNQIKESYRGITCQRGSDHGKEI